MTALLRNSGTNQLLLSFVLPHKPFPTATFWRWCATVITKSGINVNIFGSHSTRSLSTSKCKIFGIFFIEIAKIAEWLNEKTFAHFYDRPIQEDFSKYLARWKFLFFICICTYMVLFIQKHIYGVTYSGNNINQIEKILGFLLPKTI